MSQFFWKVKLQVLLNHLPLISEHEKRQGKDEPIATQLKCLEDGVMEGCDPSTTPCFAPVEFRQYKTVNPVEQVSIPLEILTCSDARKVFWWFWRCYPHSVENRFCSNDSTIRLDSQHPDWSQASLSTALAGAHLGYFPCPDDYSTQRNTVQPSCAYLATFSFTAIQPPTQACCTLQNIQFESWLSYYLAAKICWKVAWKYGPDIFLAPSLYAQPLIDAWLLQHYPDFSQWISAPTERHKRRAVFPNTLTMLLPDNGAVDLMTGNPVWATMLYAEQVLKHEWLMLTQRSPNPFKQDIEQQATASQRRGCWQESQWHSCWVALPVTKAEPNLPTYSAPSKSLIREIYRQLEVAQYSQVWKIPTAFSVQSTRCEWDAGLPPDPTLAPNKERFDCTEPLTIGDGVTQELPYGLALGEPCASPPRRRSAIAPLTSDPLTESTPWRVFIATGVALTPNHHRNNAEAELAAYAAHHRILAHRVNPLIADLVEQRYGGQLIYARNNEILLTSPLQRWEDLLWDIHHLVKGEADLEIERLATPENRVANSPWDKPQMGRWHGHGDRNLSLQQPLCSSETSLRFRLVIAHDAVPLPIVLNNLWDAKSTSSLTPCKPLSQDGVEVCVLDPSGQRLMATAEWNAFDRWRSLISLTELQPTLIEQIANCWRRHPAPSLAAIALWVTTLCTDLYNHQRAIDAKDFDPQSIAQAVVCERLTEFLECLWQAKPSDERVLGDRQIQDWLDLAAFTVRNR